MVHNIFVINDQKAKQFNLMPKDGIIFFKELNDVSFQLSFKDIKWYSTFHLREHFSSMGCKPSHTTRMIEHFIDRICSLKLPLKSSSKNNVSVKIPLISGLITFEEKNSIVMIESRFRSIVYEALRTEGYIEKHHVVLFNAVKEIKESERSFVILLSGTSGTGKSTLASFLSIKLGAKKLVTTDSVRHQLRSSLKHDECPILFHSTYDSYKYSNLTKTDNKGSFEEHVLEGYNNQSQYINRNLETLIVNFLENEKGLMIVEGVHLTMNFIVSLLKRYPQAIVPFVVFISNGNKHKERFAVRGKYMTLDERTNNYVQHFEEIRMIQKHLVSSANVHLIPKIDNTNVDRSIASIHSIILRCLYHIKKNRNLFDPKSEKASLMNREFRKTHDHAWSSKAMQEVIRMKVQKKELFDRLFSNSKNSNIKSFKSGEESQLHEKNEKDETKTSISSKNSANMRADFSIKIDKLEACNQEKQVPKEINVILNYLDPENLSSVGVSLDDASLSNL